MARILVVEDDEQLRENITEQLQLNRHQVQSATNGVEAFTLLPTFLPNLILCDIMMPEMDGIDFIRAVKRNASYRSIPFIFLTAKVSQQDLIRGLEEGAVDYLAKPFLHRELLLKINNITTQQTEYLVNALHQESDESPDFQFARQFTQQLELHFENASFTADQMAECMNMSLSALQRNLKDQFQHSFSDLLKGYRLRKAMNYLSQTDQSVQSIAARCGFGSLSYFSFCFKATNHLSPLRFRAINRRELPMVAE